MIRVLAWPAFRNRNQNPYQSMLYESMADMRVAVEEFSPGRLLFGRHAIWHLHWPDLMLLGPSAGRAALRVTLLLALMELARARGVRTVWTMHNLKSHESTHPRIESWFWRAFTRRLDGIISLSNAARQAALDRHIALRNIPCFVIPHGHYRTVYPDGITREQARKRLNIGMETPVMAYVGLIRDYKNVPHLIRTFRLLAIPSLVLLVAGKPGTEALKQEVTDAAADDPRVKLHLDFVPAGDLQLYLRAADLVVLPYSDILNSGSALLALSFDCPLLIPRLGGMQELQQQVGEQWVCTYPADLTTLVLQDALLWVANTPRPRRAPLDALEWRGLAAKTVDAYRHLCGGSRDAG